MNKMKTKLNIIGIITIILILCLNNFAAIVSGNDGSSFITKQNLML